MRIQGNLFRGQRPNNTLPIVLGVWLLAASIGALTIFFIRDTQALRKQEPAMDARLWSLQEQITQASTFGNRPTPQDLAAMEGRVHALNTVTGIHGLSISELFILLEEQLPKDVWLMSMHHKAREGETMLVAEAADPESLTRFMHKLELDPRFSQVLLVRRGSRSNKGKLEAVQFEIRVRHKS